MHLLYHDLSLILVQERFVLKKQGTLSDFSSSLFILYSNNKQKITKAKERKKKKTGCWQDFHFERLNLHQINNN